jgi:hypothetical protein
VSGEALKPCPEKVQALSSYKIPTSREDIQRLLGAFGFYRNFYPNMATVIQPLTNLLKKQSPFVWGKSEKTAYQNLIELVKNHTPLAIIDYSKPMVVKTDASHAGLGAVLLNGEPNAQIPVD